MSVQTIALLFVMCDMLIIQ